MERHKSEVQGRAEVPLVFEKSLNTKFTSRKSQESHTRKGFQSMRKDITIAIIKLARDLRGYKGFSAKLYLIFAANFSIKMISPNKFHEQIKRFEQTIVGNCLETRLWNGRPQSWRSVHFQKQFNGYLIYIEAKVYFHYFTFERSAILTWVVLSIKWFRCVVFISKIIGQLSDMRKQCRHMPHNYLQMRNVCEHQQTAAPWVSSRVPQPTYIWMPGASGLVSPTCRF